MKVNVRRIIRIQRGPLKPEEVVRAEIFQNIFSLRLVQIEIVHCLVKSVLFTQSILVKI
jgi:hypothetical protein